MFGIVRANKNRVNVSFGELRLKDPKLVKSDTQMPNLHLSEAEIEALIAFINSK